MVERCSCCLLCYDHVGVDVVNKVWNGCHSPSIGVFVGKTFEAMDEFRVWDARLRLGIVDVLLVIESNACLLHLPFASVDRFAMLAGIEGMGENFAEPSCTDTSRVSEMSSFDRWPDDGLASAEVFDGLPPAGVKGMTPSSFPVVPSRLSATLRRKRKELLSPTLVPRVPSFLV